MKLDLYNFYDYWKKPAQPTVFLLFLSFFLPQLTSFFLPPIRHVSHKSSLVSVIHSRLQGPLSIHTHQAAEKEIQHCDLRTKRWPLIDPDGINAHCFLMNMFYDDLWYLCLYSYSMKLAARWIFSMKSDYPKQIAGTSGKGFKIHKSSHIFIFIFFVAVRSISFSKRSSPARFLKCHERSLGGMIYHDLPVKGWILQVFKHNMLRTILYP